MRGDSCTVCGGPLRTDNRYGICNTTLECRRKKALVKYQRYTERERNQVVQRRLENLEEFRRKDRERYAQQRHEAVTYLAWSPGLGLLKIGVTTGLKMRYKALRNACPDVLILGILPAGRDLERYLHAQLASKCVRGEWFNLGRDSMSAISAVVEAVRPQERE